MGKNRTYNRWRLLVGMEVCMEKIIEVLGLKKSYDTVEAVKGIDFYVEKGSLFAFLGPNGAGKSTTIDIISTLLEPDAGTITIDGYILGKNDNEIRSRIGIVFQDSLLDDDLTVRENLMIRGGLYKQKRPLDEALTFAAKATGIDSFIDRPYKKLSGGQKRRADIARALMNKPKILILDEPTTGLDPETRQNLWDTIVKLQKEENMTIFLTTHYMEEAARANYVVVIDNGIITAKGTPSQLKEEHSSDSMTIHTKDIEKIEEILRTFPITYEICVDTINITLESTLEAIPIIEACKDYIIGFQVIKGTMDDAFIHITRKGKAYETLN